MDIGPIESSTRVLKKTITFLPDGRVKETVERQIRQNIQVIDEYFDQLADEYKSIQSYEQGGPHGN